MSVVVVIVVVWFMFWRLGIGVLGCCLLACSFALADTHLAAPPALASAQLHIKDGSVGLDGSLAYVAQQAWIQSDTLVNNILFEKVRQGGLVPFLITVVTPAQRCPVMHLRPALRSTCPSCSHTCVCVVLFLFALFVCLL